MQLSNARFSDANYSRSHWLAIIPDGVDFDTVLRKDYWAHVAAQLKIGDRVEVLSENGGYCADLVVRNCDRLTAIMGVINFADFESPALLDVKDPEYEVKWGGPHDKWRVVRISDGAVVQKGLPSKEDAERQMQSYIKALAS